MRPIEENVDIDPKTAAVWDIAEPIALELGLELVDIEYRREGRGSVLRLLIDRASPGVAEGTNGAAGPTTKGVTLDELTAVSRQVSDVLDVREDAVPGAYTLEVSSPGINRPLTRPSHFARFVGKRVHVETRRGFGTRHSFRGTLTAASADGITVTSDDAEAHDIPFDAISRANYQHEFPSVGKRRPDRRGATRPTQQPAPR